MKQCSGNCSEPFHWMSWLPLWGITDPYNKSREAFGAEIHPAPKVDNIRRKLVQRNASTRMPPYCAQTPASSQQKYLHATTGSPPDEVANEPIWDEFELCGQHPLTPGIPAKAHTGHVNQPHQLSEARVAEQSLSSSLHFYCVDLAQDLRAKQQL